MTSETEATEPKMFDYIINWSLKSGSHPFPGPDGGTCINEAAIVAAGFEYREIKSAEDCPPCFSRPIAAYALQCNDRMDNTTRNELLMPFVTRLAGTADTPEVERARVEYMVIETVRRILPGVLRLSKLDEHAKACEASVTFEEARAAATAAYATAAAAANAAYAAARREVWLTAMSILDGAIKLGNQGDHLAVEAAVERLNAARKAAVTA